MVTYVVRRRIFAVVVGDHDSLSTDTFRRFDYGENRIASFEVHPRLTEPA
jgi:hypothetical protein